MWKNNKERKTKNYFGIAVVGNLSMSGKQNWVTEFEKESSSNVFGYL